MIEFTGTLLNLIQILLLNKDPRVILIGVGLIIVIVGISLAIFPTKQSRPVKEYGEIKIWFIVVYARDKVIGYVDEYIYPHRDLGIAIIIFGLVFLTVPSSLILFKATSLYAQNTHDPIEVADSVKDIFSAFPYTPMTH